jgi:tetratricopeptide (TPR) repeat protein
VEELIPIPVLVGTFAVLIVVVISLLSPGWMENMRAVLARLESRAHNHEKALAYYEALVKDRPDNPSYLGELAYTLVGLGRYDEAVQMYEKATELLLAMPMPDSEERGVVRPSPDHYSAEIGRALFLAGKLSEAKVRLERYLKNVNRQHGMSHYYLAQIYLKEGNLEQAAAHLVAARDSGLGEDLLQPVRKEILNYRLPEDLR